MLACMTGGLAVCIAANAVTTEDSSANPYQSIIDRNVFSLKPPPPPPDPSETTKPTALKITLTGITTILGNKRVLMKTAPPPGKPGETPKEQYYILTEGQREGEIEVVSIDEKAGSVKVKNAGTDQTLTFEKDGAKLPATQPPAAAPGAPGAVPPVPGLPGTRPAPNAPAGATPSFQLPTRIPRLPTGNQSAALTPGAAGSGVPLTGGVAPGYGTPGFLPGNTTTPITQNPAQAAQPVNQLSPEEQAIMIEANRQRGGIGSGLLPPTVLSPKLNEAPPTPAQNVPNPAAFIPPIPGRPPGPY